jgi:3-oxoacyl-[acyl-carrier protein] reductase
MSNGLAIVTGASRGIGRAIALRLAREGFDLALAARTEADLEAVGRECEAEGASAAAVACDVSREDDVRRLFDDTRERVGRLDLLVNNAGVGIYGPIAETTLDDYERVMGVNLRGVFLCSREAMRWMMEAGRGTIVNISSVVGIKGYVNQAIYTASKHGVVGLTRVMAEEGREHGIRAHVICPGGVATDLISQARPDIRPEELLQPEDVAELVAYLVSLPRRATVDIVHLRRYTSGSF